MRSGKVSVAKIMLSLGEVHVVHNVTTVIDDVKLIKEFHFVGSVDQFYQA